MYIGRQAAGQRTFIYMRAGTRLGGRGENHDADPTAFYRRQFSKLLDVLDTQLEERFDQSSMHKVAEVERLLEDAAAGKAYAVPAAVKELYGRDVDAGASPTGGMPGIHPPRSRNPGGISPALF